MSFVNAPTIAIVTSSVLFRFEISALGCVNFVSVVLLCYNVLASYVGSVAVLQCVSFVSVVLLCFNVLPTCR